MTKLYIADIPYIAAYYIGSNIRWSIKNLMEGKTIRNFSCSVNISLQRFTFWIFRLAALKMTSSQQQSDQIQT